MFLAIPLFSVISQFLDEFIDKRLKEKNIDNID
jgi:hypothetical protein